MQYNPETLKYTKGKHVVWTDNNGTICEGIVSNVCFDGVEVVKDHNVILIPFESIKS
jgi:hypothetical protein